MTRDATVLYWFRRALRVDDNRGLAAAVASAETVVPVFVLDPALLSRPDVAPVRVRFLYDALSALDAQLRARGGRLIVRSGDPALALAQLAQETGATALFHAREYEPFGLARDTRVAAALAERGVRVETHSDHLLVEPWEVATGKGTPYTVYTPFRKAWEKVALAAPIDPPARVRVPSTVASLPLPTLPSALRPPVAAADGDALLAGFLDHRASDYADARDRVAEPATSFLSAHLKFGAVSARRILAAVRARESSEGLEKFVAQLAWRDFYYHVLWHFPHVADGAMYPAFDALAWENDPALLAAWQQGRTGFPLVDAGMRQLAQTGWMHNRARMVVASFLTRDLRIDGRIGERWFMEHLVDGDQANNNGGWQWAAGTGTDAQPWFRTFNPVLQGERFDPDGAYVRRWVPELAKVPAKKVHRPWELSEAEQQWLGCRLGRDYPAPCVDRAAGREKTLQMYRRATGKES